MASDEKPRPTIAPSNYPPPKRPVTPFILAGLGIVLAIAAAGLQMNHYEDEAPWLAAIGFMLIVTGVYGIWKARDE